MLSPDFETDIKFDGIETRHPSILERMNEKILEVSNRNKRNFGMKDPGYPDKIEKLKPKHSFPIQIMTFEDGSYVQYIDNYQEGVKFESPLVMVAIHAIGFSHFRNWDYFRETLGHSYCRFIAFGIPGQDRQPFMRGEFTGGYSQTAKLLNYF